MAGKKNTKGISAFIIVAFVVVCFSLLVVDVVNRFYEANGSKSEHPTVVAPVRAAPSRAGAQKAATKNGVGQKELTPEELDKLIKEYMRGEAGG